MGKDRLTGIQPRTEEEKIWRPLYHFTPPTAWMNDPNGLIYYKGWYHLFYQYNPNNCDWASMHWGHAVSEDMVHWKDMPIALTPDKDYDCHPEGGCFSGSAVEKDGILYLFYTATTIIDGEVRQSQCLVTSCDGSHFEKFEGNPVIGGPPEGASADFRDPKVFCWNGKWYMVVGGTANGTAKDGDGRVFLYESEDLYHWKYRGAVLKSNGKLGTMFECPDLFFLDGKWVLTCSPMNHPEYNKALYCVGEMDFDNCRYTIEKIGNMDVGFDYYAPQSFLDAKGNRILMAWQNGWLWMPWCRDWGPTSSENWRGTLSIPRKVSLDKDWNLCMYPVEEIDELVCRKIAYQMLEVGTNRKYLPVAENRSYRLRLMLDVEKVESRDLEICVLGKGHQYTMISVDMIGQIVSVDKSAGDCYEKGRMNCPIRMEGTKLDICILVDRSCVEVYIDHGRHCITTNVYPGKEQTECWLQTPYKTAVIDYVQIDFMKPFWDTEE